ncbi:SixA phosphatase family protein [Acidipropionibacterium timonense]|uniref:SixA phosphatase family protein n=1 Tax=Acidipropionibacterium timonense TaxID=2161818 RepID=UPI00102F48ED|nr:histidine phosphatase family protein [Acidipropionibacterium timonense]
MHTLFLMRHAQPAHVAPNGGGDHDRPLTALGRRQAAEAGRTLTLRGVDLAMVSSSVRTRQTFECLGLDCEVETMRALYGAGVGTVRQRISETPEEVGTLLVVAHSPAIPQLAAQLSDASDPAAASELSCHFPAGTLTEIRLDGPWTELLDEYSTATSLVATQEPAL